jgi:Protein of unknown function (DUF2917)
MSLYPDKPYQIRVTQGRLWVTTTESREDYVVHAGEHMQFAAGAHVVLEAWSQNQRSDARFAWIGVPPNEITFPRPQDPLQTSVASARPLTLAE